MAITFMFNRIPIQVAGNHPVINLILEEFCLFPRTTLAPQVLFYITNKPFEILPGALELDNTIIVDDNGVYFQLPFFRTLLRLEGKVRFIEEGKDPLRLTLWPRDTVPPRGIWGKIKDIAWQIRNWTFLPSLAQLSYNIINGGIEPCLLFFGSRKRTLLHASSLVKDGRAVLLTGWGGVGKTSAEVSLVFDYGWQFLSDDISLIGDDGIATLYPRHLMVYAYNLVNNPTLQRAVFDSRSLVDQLQWRLRRWLRGPMGVRRRVAPQQLFGSAKIGQSGHIAHVIELVHHHAPEFLLEDIDLEGLVRRAAHTIAAEYYFYFRYIDALGALGQEDITVERILERVRAVYRCAFATAKLQRLLVPVATTPGALAGFLADLLD